MAENLGQISSLSRRAEGARSTKSEIRTGRPLSIEALAARPIKIDAAPGIINVTFRPNPPVEPMRIIELVQKNKHIKLAGNDKLRIEKALSDPKDRAQYVRDLLRQLGQPLKV